ncbi:MAG: HEAT repeat domain-containing protein [Anaerolinea sp.]|nr:HEAT repeat domain-containing protein [Anaerolinea sp.]
MVYRLDDEMDGQVNDWIADLEKADINIRQRARRRLIAYEGDIAKRMIDVMCEEQGRRSWEAAIILSERHEVSALNAMKQMLVSRHPVLGQIAAETLAGYGTRFLDDLIAALPISTYLTQIAIISVLERIGDQRAVAPLMAFVQTVTTPMLIYTSLRALGALGDPSAIDLIRRYLKHEDAHVLKRARMALQELEKESRSE